jgi:hypothetical protein
MKRDLSVDEFPTDGVRTQPRRSRSQEGHRGTENKCGIKAVPYLRLRSGFKRFYLKRGLVLHGTYRAGRTNESLVYGGFASILASAFHTSCSNAHGEVSKPVASSESPLGEG